MKNPIRDEALGKPQPVALDNAEKAVNYLQGKVLTIIEATLEGTKLKATKDLIKGHFSDCHMQLLQLAYPKIKMMTEVEAEISGVAEEAALSIK